jgi:hypothetical protein
VDAEVDEAAGDPGGEGSCSGDLTDCGGICVDLSSNHDNCGACGNECLPQELCSGGDCVMECPPDRVPCNGTCVLPFDECNGVDDDCDGLIDEDFECVLGSEEPCTLPGSECSGTRVCLEGCTWADCDNPAWGCDDPGGVGSCMVGNCEGIRECLGNCTWGECTVNCPGSRTCCPGGCVDLSNDAENCGECGFSCSGHGSCVGGSCRCDAGYTGGHCDACDRENDYYGYPDCRHDPPTGTCGCRLEEKPGYEYCDEHICRPDPSLFDCGGCGGADNRECRCRSCLADPDCSDAWCVCINE